MNPVLIVAGKELRDGLRDRWLLAITLVFVLFATGIAYFGAAASGHVGFTSLSTTIVSLASLGVFVIPLIALLLAYDGVVGEDERGTLLLLLACPLGRVQLIAGKFLGYTAIMAISTAAGFGVAGGLITLLSPETATGELWAALGFFILTAILLGCVFVAIAILISVVSRDKARAAGLALLVWFLFVLVFDLGLLAVLVLGSGSPGAAYLPYLLLLNPTDVFRLANLTGFEAAQVQAGLLAVTDVQLRSPALLTAVLAVWAAVPLGLGAWLFSRREV